MRLGRCLLLGGGAAWAASVWMPRQDLTAKAMPGGRGWRANVPSVQGLAFRPPARQAILPPEAWHRNHRSSVICPACSFLRFATAPPEPCQPRQVCAPHLSDGSSGSGSASCCISCTTCSQWREQVNSTLQSLLLMPSIRRSSVARRVESLVRVKICFNLPTGTSVPRKGRRWSSMECISKGTSPASEVSRSRRASMREKWIVIRAPGSFLRYSPSLTNRYSCSTSCHCSNQSREGSSGLTPKCWASSRALAKRARKPAAPRRNLIESAAIVPLKKSLPWREQLRTRVVQFFAALKKDSIWGK